jgi:hypothetical protein
MPILPLPGALAMTPLRTLAFVSFTAIACNAFAQTAAPATGAAAATAGAVPAPNCTRPGPHPGGDAKDLYLKNWAKAVTNYLDCLKKFVNDQQALARPLVEEANLHLNAAKAATEEHNKAVVDFKAEADAALK